MIPAGYLLKRLGGRTDWLKAPQVTEVCSVSDCVNDNVVDLQSAWAHNRFGLANDPNILWRLAEQDGADISDAELFYYEAYEQEADNDSSIDLIWTWRPWTDVPATDDDGPPVKPSNALRLLGYDIVTCDYNLEHSPLSCNHMAESLPVNRYCLFSDLEQAIVAVESGVFTGCKPGIYKIYSVYRIEKQ